MSMLVRADNLTDKHFKSRHRQRIHRDIKGFLDVDLFWLSAFVGSFCAAALVQFLSEDYLYAFLFLIAIPLWLAVPAALGIVDNSKPGLEEWGSLLILFFASYVFGPFAVLFVVIFGIWLNAFFGSLFYYPTYYLWSAIACILYSPSERQKEILLIDPDGNPEICNWLNEYPALEGFYGYRLPNADDLHKIAVYLDNRGLKQ